MVEGCYKGQVLALLIDHDRLVCYRIIGTTIGLLTDVLHKLFLLQLLGKLIKQLSVQSDLLQKCLRKTINS